MSIMPQGEAIRNAVKWIGEERKYAPNPDVKSLVEKASIRFNLSPKESEFLLRLITEENV